MAEKQAPLLGFDIGGTKCAVCIGRYVGDTLTVEKKDSIPTDLSVAPETMLDRLMVMADRLLGEERPRAIGVSCGGPLNSVTGRVMGPPNLPGWDDVPVVELLQGHYGAPAALRNDADAGALAEWRFGAGAGCRHMIFLTFGTGLGAGLILGGRLHRGACDMAGEVGHVRLEPYGPVGYGKCGSFEGFCSGGGIAQLAQMYAKESRQQGREPAYGDGASAKEVAEAARAGDSTALNVFDTCARQLGRGLAMLIDILNPERIVIGSLFGRCHDLLWERVQEGIRREALPVAAEACQVVPASLGESIGDYAALAVAEEAEEQI